MTGTSQIFSVEFVEVAGRWRLRNIDVESSARLGAQRVAEALRRQARDMVPLLKSWIGVLAFRTPDRKF